MPHVSRHKLSKKNEKELINTLKIVLSNIQAKDKMELFMLSLLTETERLMFAKRLAMALFIKENVSESAIANSLHVTRSTVDRFKLFMEVHGEGFEEAFIVLKKEKQFEEFKKFLMSLTRYAVRAAGGYVKPTILD